MRAAFRLLTLLCFAWCALGIAEPASAHGDSETHAVSDVGNTHNDNAPGDVALDGHHHCPLAYELASAPAAAHAIKPRSLTVRPKTTTLASLAHAPPLQPPAA